MKYKSDQDNEFLSNDLFIRWVKTADAELDHYWKEWIDAHPEKVDDFLEARSILLKLDFKREKLPADEKSSLWTRIEKNTVNKTPVSFLRRKITRRRFAVAAAISALLVIGGRWMLQGKDLQVITTDFGERKEVVLKDGTSVILNANSRLSYDAEKPREVYLKGEAYFEVTKKARTGASFIVHTHDLSIRVLGTVFNVNNRNGMTEVFLEEGKINLEIEDADINTIEMTPGDLVTYSKSENRLSDVNKAIAVENTSWKDGTLVFKETLLKTVLDDLSEIYGVSFLIEDKTLAQKRISGGLPIKNLEIALETLRGIYGIEIKKQDKGYVISK